jgi:curli biogenesis system outer membrane secretion channel CsgG
MSKELLNFFMKRIHGRNKNIVSALFLIILIMAGCATTAEYRALPADAVKPVVAVSSFENRSGFSGEWQLGGGMADLLVSELVLSKNFVVLERQNLDRVTGEIYLQKKEMFRPEGKVEPGKLKNAQYFVRGVINDFSQVEGGSLFFAISGGMLGGRGYNARVAMTLSLVEIESGEILNSVQCTGTARAREAYGAGSYKGVSFGGDAFFRTPLGQATRDAIRQGVMGIIESLPVRSWKPMIAEVENGRILLNGGADRGYVLGQVYIAREPARPVTDPNTGDVISYLSGKEVGWLRVFQVDQKIAIAEAIQGSGFRRGMPLFVERR